MKLTSLKFLGANPPIPGFRELGKGPYEHFAVHIRQHAVFLVSPVGWRLGTGTRPDGRTVYEVPRAICQLTWEIEDGEDLANTAKYEPPIRSPHPQETDVDPATRAAEGPSAPPSPAGARVTTQQEKRR